MVPHLHAQVSTGAALDDLLADVTRAHPDGFSPSGVTVNGSLLARLIKARAEELRLRNAYVDTMLTAHMIRSGVTPHTCCKCSRVFDGRAIESCPFCGAAYPQPTSQDDKHEH